MKLIYGCIFVVVQIGLNTVHNYTCMREKKLLAWDRYRNRHCIKKWKKKIRINLVLFLRYWRFNEEMRTMDPGYPKPITIWRGVPDSPQGAFVDKAKGTMCPVPLHSNLAEPVARPHVPAGRH